MKPLIAISGKGGTGKSTLAALLVHRLVAAGIRPVLAVDADPNACLAPLLGLASSGTIGGLREAARPVKDAPGTMPKAAEVELRLNEILAEGEGVDALTMGRPEGPGCYCYVNALLREALKRLSAGYAAMVIDNQAGMEHLSRLVTARVDALLVVAEPTVPAARAARSILELSQGLPMQIGARVLIWNKVRSAVGPAAAALVEGLPLAGTIVLPWDDRLAEWHANGGALPAEAYDLPQIDSLLQMCGVMTSARA
jgi:CO dehydrogenase maturation factor